MSLVIFFKKRFLNRKEREKEQTSLLKNTGVCVCKHAYVPSGIMKDVSVFGEEQI